MGAEPDHQAIRGRKASLPFPKVIRHDDSAGNKRPGKAVRRTQVTRDLSLRVEQGARHALIGRTAPARHRHHLLTGC